MSKGGKRVGAGRKKGSSNKLATSCKEKLEQTFDLIGGVEAFATWAQDNPRDFYQMWVKILPKEMVGDVKASVQLICSIAPGPLDAEE